MSTTERYYGIVNQALCDLSYLVEPRMYCMVTVEQVATKAGVSKVCARKYLDIFTSQEQVIKTEFAKIAFYRIAYLGED